MRKLLSIAALGAATILATMAPAMASIDVIKVPEPGTLGLLAVGIGGAMLASRYLRRK